MASPLEIVLAKWPSWGRFERFVLQEYDYHSTLKDGLMLWPWVLATFAYLIVHPVRQAWMKRAAARIQQEQESKNGK